MLVAVTGSSGKIGQAAVTALKAAGHRVVGLDLKPGQGIRTINCDCRNFGEVIGALTGVDTIGCPEAIVHLAGIPMPGLATDQSTFEVNTITTYNVFSAAARLGIDRIAWGSSETIFGLPFAVPPDFVPLTEAHPERAEWSYSLSKRVGEVLADDFCRWRPTMAIASLRFSNVYAEQDYGLQGAIERNPALRKANLWGYVDARDAGEACRLAIEASITGHQRMIIAAADSVVSIPSQQLMADFFPNVPMMEPIEGNASLLSSKRAAGLIGYEAKHSWRSQ